MRSHDVPQAERREEAVRALDWPVEVHAAWRAVDDVPQRRVASEVGELAQLEQPAQLARAAQDGETVVAAQPLRALHVRLCARAGGGEAGRAGGGGREEGHA